MTDTQRAILFILIGEFVSVVLIIWILCVLNTVLNLMSDYRNILRDIQRAIDGTD